ncbi:MAG: TIGR03842 family LLM class F420-dependent oxidoreductase [Deinococcus sp.]|nr:TIGR03842 family LLM class F420-dependent oxidoreductase [Deinococcus sp.]
MEFGITLQPDPPPSAIVALAKRAEANGFTYGWLFDSHILWQECYPLLTMMALATTKMKLGPCVTNPGTRDWTVTASVLATLNHISLGRMVCGIGRGDSARRVLGKTPMTLETLEKAVHVIKNLAEGRAVRYGEKELKIPWAKGELPIYVAGYGPKALASAGKVGDGFILQLADPYLVKWSRDRVRAAAKEAGRDPDKIKVCVAAPAYVSSDLAHAREQIRWFPAMVSNHVMDLISRYKPGKDIPQELTDYVKSRMGYDYAEHGRTGARHAAFVSDEIVDRFCLVGTEEQHIEKLRELKRLGVDQFNIYLMHDNKERTLDAYGDKIIPALRG